MGYAPLPSAGRSSNDTYSNSIPLQKEGPRDRYGPGGLDLEQESDIRKSTADRLTRIP